MTQQQREPKFSRNCFAILSADNHQRYCPVCQADPGEYCAQGEERLTRSVHAQRNEGRDSTSKPKRPILRPLYKPAGES